MNYRFTAILAPQPEGGFHAFCPALKGCHTEGETTEEALRNIREAIELYIDSLLAHGEPVPTQDVIVESVPVAV